MAIKIFDRITRNEKLYIVYAIIFAFIYFTIILPWAIRTFDGGSAFFEFILFNLGVVAFLQLALKAMITGKKITILTAFGLSILFVALDVMSPPYCLSPNSGVPISATLPMLQGASDCIGGNLGLILGITSTGGINIPIFNIGFIAWNYLFTYVAFPLILLILAGLLLKNFVKHL